MAEPNIAELESLSLDELRKRAMAEAQEQQQVAPTSQARDEQGRFAAANDEEQETEEETEEEPKQLFRRVVDIGEGVEPEVFEADTLEALIDKIAEAKAHATKKIRSQEAELRKSKEAQAPKPRQFSEDEEFVFSQELMQKPTVAFQKMFKELVGMDISQFKTVAEKANALDAAKSRDVAINSFLTTHPSYKDTQRNTDLMQMALGGRDVTAESLSKAYESLVSKGLLDTGEGEQSQQQEEATQTKTAIPSTSAAKTPSAGTKKASSLKARSAAPVVSNEPTEADLYAMPIDQLKGLAAKQSASR